MPTRAGLENPALKSLRPLKGAHDAIYNGFTTSAPPASRGDQSPRSSAAVGTGLMTRIRSLKGTGHVLQHVACASASCRQRAGLEPSAELTNPAEAGYMDMRAFRSPL